MTSLLNIAVILMMQVRSLNSILPINMMAGMVNIIILLNTIMMLQVSSMAAVLMPVCLQLLPMLNTLWITGSMAKASLLITQLMSHGQMLL